MTGVIIVSAIGLACSILLVVASRFLSVPTDTRVEDLRGFLPGANCGACAKACPHLLIGMVPVKNHVAVRCSSRDKGAVVRKVCSAGCIGCMMCTKVCPTGAITVSDFLAAIDPEKCTNCGACAEKCPVKVISVG